MAYRDETKKSIKGLKPIEAGFVKYFEMIENAFKNINDSMGGLIVPDPPRAFNKRASSGFM